MNAAGVISPLRIREPGLNTLPANTERYVVRAGGITALDLFAGDRINLVSPEGRQKGEITVFDQHGNSDMQCIDAHSNGRAEGFKHILAGDDANAVKLARVLEFRNISLKSAHSTTVFSDESPAGDSSLNTVVLCADLSDKLRNSRTRASFTALASSPARICLKPSARPLLWASIHCMSLLPC